MEYEGEIYHCLEIEITLIAIISDYKTGVVNDPLSQTHSHASSGHCFLLFCFSRFEKWGRTDNINNDHYQP